MSNLIENHCSRKLPTAVSGWTFSKGFSKKARLVTLCPEPSQASGGHGRLSADLSWERNYRNKAFCKCWYNNGISISPLSPRKPVFGNRTQISDRYFPLHFPPPPPSRFSLRSTVSRKSGARSTCLGYPYIYSLPESRLRVGNWRGLFTWSFLFIGWWEYKISHH